jgi:hypothetical protein
MAKKSYNIDHRQMKNAKSLMPGAIAIKPFFLVHE